MSGSEPSLPPVVKRLRLSLSVEEAFLLFTRDIGRWWPLSSHSCSLDGGARLDLDGRVGGEVVERTDQGKAFRWGTILVWEPPHRFAMTWHPGFDSKEATRVEVCFEADGNGCVLRLVHSGWQARGEAAAPVRDRYDEGWLTVIGRFADFVRTQT